MVSDISTILDIRQTGTHAFVLRLTDGSEFVCEQVVRVLPGRRLVCRGVWKGRAVFAKLFMGPSAAAYARRDREGSQSLEAAGVLTPALLYNASIAQEISLLIYAAVMPAENAEHCWRQQPQLHQVLAQSLVDTLAKHHSAGLRQTDLHLKNFLVQVQSSNALNIYTLDGDGIRKLGSWHVKSRRLSNLATLFSKFDVLDDGLIPVLYRQYCTAMGESYSVTDERHVIKLVWRIRQRVSRTYADKKVFRTCTGVTVHSSFKHFHAVAADILINPKIATLDTYLADPKANLKNGNTCTVGWGELGSQRVVIKRYNIKNAWHGLNRALRPSRAAVSWANAHRLIISNIATPKPLALMEERWGCLRGRAYFLSAYVDAPDVTEFFAQQLDVESKNAAAQCLVNLFLKLYLLKFAHGDCKGSNIKMVNGQPVLIDLDSMRSYGAGWLSNWRFERAHVKDLQRFMQNWQGDATVLSLLKQVFQSSYPEAAKSMLKRAGIL